MEKFSNIIFIDTPFRQSLSCSFLCLCCPFVIIIVVKQEFQKLVTLVTLLMKLHHTKNTWSSSAAIKNLLKVKSLKHHFA